MKIPTNGNGTISIDAMLAELKRERFFGSIEISIQNGEPTCIRKHETENLKALGTTDAKYQKT